MITVNKANPTQGEITSSLTGSTGDGAGLHLEAGGTITLTNAAAAEFGTSDFSLEFVLNRTANNTNNNVIYESHSSGNNRITLKALTGGDLVATFTNSSGVNADYNTGYDIDVDLNTVTHYALTFDRSGDLTVYKNGNSVATISISASSAVDIGDSNTNTGRIGYVTTYGVIGTFYRFRAFNTLADAKLLFERADVPQTLTANLLFDLDLAFANPTQSLTVQDRKGNTDGTASSSTLVTQVQPVVQLNSTSARIGTTQATPADGEVIADKVKIGTESFTPHASVDDLIIAPSGAAAGLTIRAGSNSGTSRIAFADLASTTVGLMTYNHNTDNLTLAADDDVVLSSGAGTGSLSLDANGNVMLGTPAAGSAAAMFHISGAAPRIRLEDTSAPANYSQIGADNGQLTLAADGGQGQASSAVIAQVDGSERMRIDSTGAVTVGTGGTASANTALTIDGTNATNKGPRLAFGRNSTNVGLIGTESGLAGNNSDDLFIFAETGRAVKIATNGAVSPKLTIDSTGLATFSNGIALQTSPSNDSATANEAYTLDKYETGTWTCTLNGASSVGNTTGHYTRIGNICHFTFYSGSLTSTAVDATFSGLPFTASAGYYSVFSAAHNTICPNADSGFVAINTDTGKFTASNSTAVATYTAATGRYVMITGTYTVA